MNTGMLFSGPMLIGIVFMLVGAGVAMVLKSKFAKYSKEKLMNGMTGKQVAEKMLADHGIHNVKVMSVQGQLTDHYNPANHTVNLSEGVYNGTSAASAAVAAHECGHAVQHATAYRWLKFRSALVPIQQVSGTILNFIIMIAIFGGAALYNTASFDTVLYILIGCYGAFTLFSLVTLPVEFDASNRAMRWMTDRGIVTNYERADAKDALKWAAMTYVVAAIGSIVTLLYYLSLLNSRRD